MSACCPPQVSTAPVSYGVNIKTLVTYLLVYQHVPVARCAQFITDVAGGSKGPSTGFVHGMLARCAAVVRPVVEVIKDMIRRARVAGFDETTLRVGGAGDKKYVLLGLHRTGHGLSPGRPRPRLVYRGRYPARFRRDRRA